MDIEKTIAGVSDEAFYLLKLDFLRNRNVIHFVSN